MGTSGPGQQAYLQPGRLPELSAMLAWILSSWLRPADADAGWAQKPGRRPPGHSLPE